jgi:hypothetical protein
MATRGRKVGDKGKDGGGYGGGGDDNSDRPLGPGEHSGAHAVPIHEADLSSKAKALGFR